MYSRRKFIKSTGILSASAVFVPSLGFTSISNKMSPDNLQNYTLKGFHDEQEESPAIVSNGSGEMWMFSLRRLKYPEDRELVSAFRYDGKSWHETIAVTKTEGQFEAPFAACAPGGKPVVAWTEKKNDDWLINVAVAKANGFSDPFTFTVKSGRSINPCLITPDKDSFWIAWENLYNAKLTIYLSKYENGQWSEPINIDKGENSCFDPAMAQAKNGDLYVAYGVTHGYHQNIEMSIIDGQSFAIKKTVPIAIGGGLKNRINLNTKPALAFDALDRLWISYENNRDVHRLEDGDNYTGDRCCAIISYQDDRLVETELNGKWLFSGKNDHKPTFIKDNHNRLYLATHCGGDFKGNPFWQYRLSWLDPQKGWSKPATILKTSQKGKLIPPAIAFDNTDKLWLATIIEKRFDNREPDRVDDVVCSLLGQLTVQQISAPNVNEKYAQIKFRKTEVKEFLPDDETISQLSGHPRIHGEQITAEGVVYTLVYGNLHEHSENSPCWPAGTDGTLHDDYRFGLFSENYDFVGITDHGYSMTEVYWRKNVRLAEFYNESHHFVAIPAMEWTLTTGRNKELGSVFGSGHYNVIFTTPYEARKFIRNSNEIYNVYTPETKNSELLWKLLHEKQIDCITIPQHPADEIHPVDWRVHDDKFVPVVEMFQCRGNAEYPGCPREINLERHRPNKSEKAYINYALKEKKYKMGFIASGDHNSMGVGVAALWVKELSRKGIFEALRNRRCFATTGDKMIIDFRVNGSISDIKKHIEEAPEISINVKGQRELDKVEILRNSAVIKEYKITESSLLFRETFKDENYMSEKEVLYYYVRVTQQNNEIGWSSPIWIEHADFG